MSTKKLSDYEKFRNTAIGGGAMLGIGAGVKTYATRRLRGVAHELIHSADNTSFNHAQKMGEIGKKVASSLGHISAANHVMRVGGAAAIVGGLLAYKHRPPKVDQSL